MGDAKMGNVLLAGNQEKLIELDIETRQNVRLVDIFENDENGIRNCYYMKGHPKFLCMADCDGKVFDQFELELIKLIKISILSFRLF